jgi:hypothetical protein
MYGINGDTETLRLKGEESSGGCQSRQVVSVVELKTKNNYAVESQQQLTGLNGRLNFNTTKQ